VKSQLALFAALTVMALAVAACNTLSATPTQPPARPPTQAANPAGGSTNSLARTDEQGAVVFAVTPLNLEAPGDTLDFDVSLNTHSVNLAWDLAAQSTLSTDTGLAVTGQSWPVGSGHHYDGTLSFPATTSQGQPLLEGAKTMTLTIRDTDVPRRVFTWDLEP
jgi:hypothetical protein